jgi:hypothetical protein
MVTGSPTLAVAYLPCIFRLRSIAQGLGYSTAWAKRAGSQSTIKLKASGCNGFPGNFLSISYTSTGIKNPYSDLL